MYRLITNVKCRVPEEMQCSSFSHLAQPGTLILPRLLCFTGCNKGDCKQNYHCKTFQLLGEKNRRTVSITFPTHFSCNKEFIWSNFCKTKFSGVLMWFKENCMYGCFFCKCYWEWATCKKVYTFCYIKQSTAELQNKQSRFGVCLFSIK